MSDEPPAMPESNYDAWFDAEIEQALKEADDPSIRKIPDDVVRENLMRRIASFQNRR